MVRDPEGLQQTEADGHPCQTYAEDHQVLATAQSHPETHRGRRPETLLGPDGIQIKRS